MNNGCTEKIDAAVNVIFISASKSLSGDLVQMSCCLRDRIDWLHVVSICPKVRTKFKIVDVKMSSCHFEEFRADNILE